jgi:fatty acid desaturase
VTPSRRPGDRLDAAQLRALSQLAPGRIALAIASTWAVLLLAVAGALAAPLWALVPLAVVIGNRQYALLLLVHEASHYLFSRDRKRNDRIANWTCAYPIGITVERYREVHLEHHRHVGTEADPDFDYYRERVTPGLLVRTILVGLFGVKGMITVLFYFFPRFAARYHPSPEGRSSFQASPLGRQLAGVAAAQLVILGSFALLGRPLLYFGIWLLPLLTLVPLANQLRTLAEHASLDGTPVTRTVTTGVVGRVVLAPFLFFYHHEHHLHPFVPFYRLPELHRRLHESGHYAEPPPPLASSYPRTFGALLRGRPSPTSDPR